MRILKPAIKTAFAGNTKRAATLVKIDWPSGSVRVHNGVGPLSYDSEIWYGVGELGKIGNIEEGDTTGQMKFTLTTNDEAQIAEIVQDDAGGSKVEMYLAALNDDFEVIDAQLFYVGYINKTPVKYSNPPTIQIDCVGLEHRWKHPREYTRYTSAAQRSKYPTDSYCDDVESVAKGPLSSYSGSQSVGGGGVRRAIGRERR